MTNNETLIMVYSIQQLKLIVVQEIITRTFQSVLDEEEGHFPTSKQVVWSRKVHWDVFFFC